MMDRANETGLDMGEEGWGGDDSAYAALARYRAVRARETATGPALSFVLHMVLLILLSFFIVPKERVPEPVVEITSIPPEPDKEVLPPEPPEPLQTEDPQVTPVVAPQVAQPAPTEMANVATDSPDDAIEAVDPVELVEIMNVVDNPSVLKLHTLYVSRTPDGQGDAVRIGGGSPVGQDAVLKALRWLASVQREDGSWEGLPAQSGLALLCFLAHGDTPLSEEFGDTVQKAIQWLATNMPEGRAWGDGDSHVAYAHGIATYALAEAYGMTRIPFLKQPVDNGIAVIVNGQQPNGGFDYIYRKGSRWDLSVTGWQMQAMKAAYIAGCANPKLPDAIERAVAFTKTTALTGGSDALAFGYTQAGKESGSGSMTGIGTVGLQLLGAGASTEAQAGARAVSARKTATWGAATQDWSTAASKHLYGWYYDTQAMFQHYRAEAPEWKAWNRSFQTALIRNQHASGYWTHEERHRMGGEALSGKVLSTTFCCLQLEVYYRHLKTYAFSSMPVAKADVGLAEGKGDLIIR